MADTPRRIELSQLSLIFASGTALFSDGYANGITGSVLIRIYGKTAISKNNSSTTISSLSFAGTIVGMLSFGYLADKVGRKFDFATGIVAIFSGLCAASHGVNGSLGGMLAMLSACRFLLGIGIGAEYSCGTVAAAEQSEEGTISANSKHRWFILATNTMLTSGLLISTFTPLVLYWIFDERHLQAVWRLSLGLGVVPALAVFIWRLRMQESLSFRAHSMKRTRIPYGLVIQRYWRRLFPLCITWFIYNSILFPFELFSSTIINIITGDSASLSVIFRWNVVINLFYMPGTIGGAFLVDTFGPKYCQAAGFAMQAIIGFILSGLYQTLTEHIAAFAVLYGLFMSSNTFGPGNCILLLSTKVAPTAIRAQFYAIAAACGKVGALIGVLTFPVIVDDFGADILSETGPFWIASALSVVGALVTMFLVRPLSQDSITEEDRLFREYLESHGYDTSMMGLGGNVTIGSSPSVEEVITGSSKKE